MFSFSYPITVKMFQLFYKIYKVRLKQGFFFNLLNQDQKISLQYCKHCVAQIFVVVEQVFFNSFANINHLSFKLSEGLALISHHLY